MAEDMISRRALLKGTGVAVAAGLVGCAGSKQDASSEDWMSGNWDGEADIVILGMGAAGLSAAIATAYEDLGTCLVLEAAPEAESGGNTRVSGQLLFIPDTPEDAIKYQTSLNSFYTVPEDLVQAWAENLCENQEWLTGLRADLQEASSCNPEFPEIEGSSGCHTWFHEGVNGKIFPMYPYTWPPLIGELAAADNQGFVDEGVIVKADTVRELAEKIGLDPDVLEETVNTYNSHCAAGKDPDFGRGEDVIGNFGGMVSSTGASSSEEKVVIASFPLEPIEAPFYAMRQYISVLNTQGGPKRSAAGEVLDTEGNPIPRLYAAGELGCIYSYQYNGGGNMSEAVSSGRLAARSASALESWVQE